MKILSLKVSNIRGIKYINLEPEGQNVVVFGPNGTGKSAIVDAIDFLLTGKISRLTGEGAKHLALTAHGCHIDCRENLENTAVVAKIEVDGEEVFLERSIKKPSSLKVKPKKHKTLIESYLKIATLGQHVLSRKQLLMYITAEAGQRAKKIMSLLNLTAIENLRGIFVSVKNKAKDELQRTESDFNIIKSEITNLLSLVNFSEKAALDKVNALREILNGSKIVELSPEKIKENLKPWPFEARAELLTTGQITNTAKELRDLIQSKDDIASQVSELITLLEEIMKEEKLKQWLLYKKLFEAGISLVDETNVCPLCGREWIEGNFREYLEAKRKEVEIAEDKQEKIYQLSTEIKKKVDLLKNDITLFVKAHKQFELDTINTEELENYLTLLDTWSESLVKPFETLENQKWPTSRLEEIFEASFLQIEIIVPVEEAIEKLGEKFSDQQVAWDTLTKMEEKWKRYQDTLKKKKADETFKKRAESSLHYFERSRDSILENIYDVIKSDFEDYYKEIHGKDEESFVSKISHTEAELNFEVDFYKRGLFPPHALHSEGHQDSMGLCLFFALNNYLVKDTIKVVVLDDVVMSIDQTHRRGVCRLLKTFFSDKQFIITTHDNAWAKQLRAEGIIPQKNMIHFVNWNIDTGPIFEMDKDLWDRIKEDLDNDRIPSAAHKLRRNAEYFFENMCDFLKAPLEYEGSHRWELGSYAPAAISTYKRYLKKAKSNFQKMKQAEKFTELSEFEKRVNEIIDKSQIEQWIINENVHYNRWEEFSRNDFEPVVEAFKDLFGLFTCSSCGASIEINKSKTKVSCSCGKIFWNVQK